jgi:hypothetical protein
LRKRTVRLAIAGVALVGAAAATIAVLPNAYAATTPTAPYTALTLNAAAPMNTFPLGTQELDSANNTVTAGYTKTSGDEFTMSAGDGTFANSIQITIESSSSGPLTQGTFAVAAAPVPPTPVVFLLSRGSSGCGTVTGTLTILDLTRDGSQNITSLSASFVVTCNTSGAITGDIRWNSNTSFAVSVPDVTTLAFGGVTVGTQSAAQTVTFTGRGPTPDLLGTATLSGLEPNQYHISADTCSGTSLSFGSTCSVSVVALLTGGGEQDAVLVLPDSSTLGKQQITLTASGSGSAGAGFFVPITPTRIMDSRIGLGAAKQPLGGGTTVHLQVASPIGLAASALSAAVLNVTATNVTGPSFITVWPSLQSRPTASSLNVVKGFTGANSVTVAVGTNGGVDIFNNAGSVDIIVDVTGYYTSTNATVSGGQFQPLGSPTRLDDTRTDGLGQLPGGDFLAESVDFGKDNNAHVTAFVVNLTATNPRGAGFLTGFNGDPNAPLPPTSTLNYVAGQTVPNFAVIPSCNVASCGATDGFPTIGVFTSQTTDVILDLVGVMDDGTLSGGLRFTPNNPTRIVDSRIGQGIAHRLGQGTTDTVVTPNSLLTMANTSALSLNVTAVNASTNTFIEVWPNGVTQPTVSNLNPATGQTIPNAAVTGLGSANDFNVFNNAGSVDMVIDVTGTFWLNPLTSTVSVAATPNGKAAGTSSNASGTSGKAANSRTPIAPKVLPSRRHKIS